MKSRDHSSGSLEGTAAHEIATPDPQAPLPAAIWVCWASALTSLLIALLGIILVRDIPGSMNQELSAGTQTIQQSALYPSHTSPFALSAILLVILTLTLPWILDRMTPTWRNDLQGRPRGFQFHRAATIIICILTLGVLGAT